MTVANLIDLSRGCWDVWKLDAIWYYWSCFAVAAEALALWDEKAVFDVVEIQSKQGNWEIIQVVERIEKN